MKKIEKEFLKESNAIEQVFDKDSLKQAEYAWAYLKSQKKMSPGVILKTHKILMLHQPIMGYQRGYFRTEAVRIGGKIKKNYGPDFLRSRLQDLCDEIEKPIHEYPHEQPDDIARECHVIFEDIHPFIDGNGRVGRLLYNWHRLRLGLQIHVIHTGVEQMAYYKWFK
jgi:Fic family protein